MLFKKNFFIYISMIGIVFLINGIRLCHLANSYTIPYPENLLDIQKTIDKNILEINDIYVTKGSIIILATTKEKKLNLYYLERCNVTIQYKLKFIDKNVELPKGYCLQDQFDKFCFQIKEMQIICNPMTIKKNIDWFKIISYWILPSICLPSVVIQFLERKK